MAIQVKTISATTYMLLDIDDGLLLRFTSNSPVNVTCPDTLVEGFTCEAVQAGDGQVTFIKGGTSQFVDTRVPITRKKGAHIAVTLDEDAVYKFNGEFTVATFLSLINQNAALAPTSTDDEDSGYTVGSTWFRTNGEVYDCVDATADNALWLLREMSNTNQRIVNTASPSAILVSDGIILFDSSASTISIDLPLANVGKVRISFKDIGANSQSNNITINRAGSDTITDSSTGQTSTIIASNGFSGTFLSNGIDTWYLM